MANPVHLVKQSNGVELPVPVGETSLGRGPFLEVTDKRVSRLHATLKLEDGQLTLCPKHKNPCFYKPTGESKFQALPKDEWRDLSHGDCFSLLPDDLVFSVKYETTETKKQTSRIKQSTQAATDSGDPLDILFSSHKTTDTDGSASNSGKAIMEPDSPVNKEAQADGTEKVPPLTSTTPSGANSATENTVRAKDSVVKPTLTSSQSGSTGKRRALPSWLSGLASEETREVSAIKKRKAPSKASISKKKDEDEELAPPLPKVRKASVSKKKDDDKELAPPPSKKKVSKKASAKVNTQIDSEDSKSLSPEVTFGASAGKDKSKDSNAKTMSDEGDSKTSKNEVSDAKSKPLCPYGPSCYRKNPVHFKEYSHDLSASASASLDSVDDSDDLDKPICPYGRDCYRKNPTHRQDYRHLDEPAKKGDSGVRRSKRATKGKRSILSGDSDDDGEPNTYDYNDSFIDDIKDDGGESSSYGDSEDSNWSPGVRDDDEDVGELVSEAKDFMSNKKMRRTT